MTRLRAERLKLAGHRVIFCRSRRRPRSLGQPFQSIVPIVNSVIGRKEKPMTHGFQSKHVDYYGFSRFFWEVQPGLTTIAILISVFSLLEE
jgi:hypothetical protein